MFYLQAATYASSDHHHIDHSNHRKFFPLSSLIAPITPIYIYYIKIGSIACSGWISYLLDIRHRRSKRSTFWEQFINGPHLKSRMIVRKGIPRLGKHCCSFYLWTKWSRWQDYKMACFQKLEEVKIQWINRCNKKYPLFGVIRNVLLYVFFLFYHFLFQNSFP